MIHLILPKTTPNLESECFRDLPLFFLLGPILGADDWQKVVAEMLESRVGDCIIVNPSWYDSTHPHFHLRMEGREIHPHQTSWERYYLQLAGSDWPTGCIVGWLPSESRTNPRKDGNPYAGDTRGEIGEWRGRFMYDRSTRFALGAQPDFPLIRTIQRNFDEALGGTFTIYKTPKQVVDWAAHLAHVSRSFERRVLA